MESRPEVLIFGQDRYSLHRNRRLGKGSYSNVYQGIDLKTNTPVAVKICKIAIDERTRKYFIREVNNLSGIRSPHVVRVLNFMITPDSATLILEYCAGPTLWKFLSTNKLSAQCYLRWMDQLLQGLNCAWTQDIVHRDIKGSNIMLTENSPYADLKLIDFGMSKILNTEFTMDVGTLKYMAPEVAQKSPYDQRADIWSLGVLFYEMSVETWPYKDTTPTQEQVNTLLQAAPDGLRQLLEYMTAIDPKNRIDHVSLLKYFSFWKGQVNDAFALSKDELFRFGTGRSYVVDKNNIIDSGVYLAVEQGTNTQAAVKICNISESAHQLIEGEIANLQKTNSQYVAKVLDFNIDATSATVILEYVAGPTLQQFLDGNGPVSAECHWRWMNQLLQGLNCTWTQGVVHRDINGTNIRLTDNSPSADLKIVDFGLSKGLEFGSEVQVRKYLAPEVLQGSAYDQRADIWSLGVLFYEMSVSDWPDSIEDQGNALANIAPEGLRTMLGCMLVVNPENRLTAVSLHQCFQYCKYDYHKMIGRTRTCEVWLATDLVTSTEVAVKIHPLLQGEREISREKVCQEKATSQFTVKLYEYFVLNQTVYLVMELCKGGTLKSFLERSGALHEGLAWVWMHQLAQGLAHISALQVIHRDIKTENIFLTEESYSASLKIGDFGISRIIATTEMTSGIGTPSYMAPEVLRMDGRYNGKVDVWSMGVVFYQIVSGIYPFEDKSREELKKSQEKIRELPSYISADCKDLIGKMLAHDPTNRLPPAHVLEHLFFRRKPLSYTEELMQMRTQLVTMSDIRYVFLASFYNAAIRLIQSQVKLAVKMERENDITCSYLSLSLSKTCIQRVNSVLPHSISYQGLKVALDALLQVVERDLSSKTIRAHNDLIQWRKSDVWALIFEYCHTCLQKRIPMQKHAFRMMKRLCRSRRLLQTPLEDYKRYQALFQSLFNVLIMIA